LRAYSAIFFSSSASFFLISIISNFRSSFAFLNSSLVLAAFYFFSRSFYLSFI
jgi:hypothetical protein